MKRHTLLAALLLATLAVAQDAPPLIEATDKAALEANKDKPVVVRGKVSSAKWSDSGKVLNIEFENAPHFMAAAFEKSRKKLDDAFSGDFAAAIAGQVVRIDGKLSDYGGYSDKYKGAVQLIIYMPTQVTIVQDTP